MKEIDKYSIRIEPGDPILQYTRHGNQYPFGTVIRYDDRFESVAVIKSLEGEEIKVKAVQVKGARLGFAYGKPTTINLMYGVADTSENSNDNHNWQVGAD
jgi:hypothetical protein